MLFNAVKLTPVGGVIGIGIRCAKASVKIDIADSRREIEADDLPHVFGVFKLQQHDNATGLNWGCMSRSESWSCIRGRSVSAVNGGGGGGVCDSVALVARWAEDA